MITTNPLLLQTPSPYDQPKLKSLPLREQPAYRVSQNAAACNLSELLAAVIGGPKQIEIAEALLTRLRDTKESSRYLPAASFAEVPGIPVLLVSPKAFTGLLSRSDFVSARRFSPRCAGSTISHPSCLFSFRCRLLRDTEEH